MADFTSDQKNEILSSDEWKDFVSNWDNSKGEPTIEEYLSDESNVNLWTSKFTKANTSSVDEVNKLEFLSSDDLQEAMEGYRNRLEFERNNPEGDGSKTDAEFLANLQRMRIESFAAGRLTLAATPEEMSEYINLFLDPNDNNEAVVSLRNSALERLNEVRNIRSGSSVTLDHLQDNNGFTTLEDGTEVQAKGANTTGGKSEFDIKTLDNMTYAQLNARRFELQYRNDLDGLDKIDIKPYNYNKKTGCDYCKYKTICMFNTNIKGNEYNYI